MQRCRQPRVLGSGKASYMIFETVQPPFMAVGLVPMAVNQGQPLERLQ
jgi:hypothetical protein